MVTLVKSIKSLVCVGVDSQFKGLGKANKRMMVAIAANMDRYKSAEASNGSIAWSNPSLCDISRLAMLDLGADFRQGLFVDDELVATIDYRAGEIRFNSRGILKANKAKVIIRNRIAALCKLMRAPYTGVEWADGELWLVVYNPDMDNRGGGYIDTSVIGYGIGRTVGLAIDDEKIRLAGLLCALNDPN